MTARIRFQHWKKTLIAIIFYDQTERPASLLSNGIPKGQLVSKIILLSAILPISLVAWAVLRVFSIRFKISIYVLKPFRPGYASTYLSMMEPLCRRLQHDGLARHLKILVEPGEGVSRVLVESYRPHFTLYLNDLHKFLRQVIYLVPKSGIEKLFIDTSRRHDAAWFFKPSRSYNTDSIPTPGDLQELDLEQNSFVLFASSSIRYYKNRFGPQDIENISYRFTDISSHELAFKKIIDLNLKVVRVGVDVEALPLSMSSLPIIDYTDIKRNELSELWLYQNCKMMISSSNGAFWFAKRFERPTLITDLYGFLHRNVSTFYIPMLINDANKGLLLSFSEMLNFSKSKVFGNKNMMENSGLFYIPNSSLSVANGSNELLSYSEGSFRPSAQDLALQMKFNNLRIAHDIPFSVNGSLISFSFLREYSHLLD
jgi:putative glycosyltransferase (TIGR04372 family)